MEDRKIWYLCDGEKPDCKKSHCYKNTDDGPCKHTRDIKHAVNFEKKECEEHVSYWERQADAEECSVTTVIGDKRLQSIIDQTEDRTTWALEQTSHQ